MNKTKLGLSVNLTAAIFYFFIFLAAFWSSNLFAFPALVLGAYILYKEDDKWLKASVVKGVLLIAFVALISLCIYYVNDLLDFINFFLGIADVSPLQDGFGIMAWIVGIIKIVEKVFFMLLAIFAFFGKTIKLPVIDKIIAKHIQ